MAFEILLLTFSSKILELSHGGHKADLWGSENHHRLGAFKSFPDGKESACNAGDPRSIPKLGRSPGEEHGNPLQYSLPGEFHGQRSLAGYSLWTHKRVRRN